MGVIESELAIKVLNGKIKPNLGFKAILAIIFLMLVFVGLVTCIIVGIVIKKYEMIIMPLLFSWAFVYWFLINPYLQRSKNYYIEFPNNNINNFKLYYKNKQVDIKYKIDKVGKIAFLNNYDKLSCISYKDNTKMSNFTKYRIMNYFGRWLHDNKLLSDEVTTTFERL